MTAIRALAPKASAKTRMRTRLGNACMASVSRWTTKSTLPRKNPERMPMVAPPPTPIARASSPMIIESFVPIRRRLNMSRPWMSVPKG